MVPMDIIHFEHKLKFEDYALLEDGAVVLRGTVVSDLYYNRTEGVLPFIFIDHKVKDGDKQDLRCYTHPTVDATMVGQFVEVVKCHDYLEVRPVRD